MATPSFLEFKKQASFFLKEKFKTARLALTDVTPAQLITEEATNGNEWAPDFPTLRSISRAAFELDDYWRIVEILHKRLVKFDKKNWRVSYNSLIVLEHLLTHGPESVADEFQGDKDAVNQMKCFQYIDDRGFNWGLTVRKKSERVLKMLQDETILKEERNRSRKLSQEIRGFGSFSQRSNPAQGIILPEKSLRTTSGRCNPDFNNHENQENQSFCSNSCETLSYQDDQGENQVLQKFETSSKENMTRSKEEFHRWNMKEESNNPLLDGSQEDSRIGNFIPQNDHPFNSTEMQATSSFLS